jgi:hypothetical protein
MTFHHKLSKTLILAEILTFIVTFIHSKLVGLCLYSKTKVGSAGFEPTTSGTQNPNHTKLDHDPDVIAQKCLQFNLLIVYDDFK